MLSTRRNYVDLHTKKTDLDGILDGITAGTDAVFDERAAALLDGDDDAPSDPFADMEGLNDSASELSDDGLDQEIMEDSEDDQDNSEGDQEQSEEEETPDEPPRKRMKLPQAAPAPDTSSSGKYIPPRLRQKMLEASSQSQSNPTSAELHRKVRGLLNRVSEGNMARVTSELETYFTSFSRHDINACLSSCILEDCSADAAQMTLLPVYAGMLALLHLTVGTDVGGSFMNYWTIKQKEYETEGQKEAYINCMKLLAFLYNYQTIHCSLLFDIIRESIERFEELDIEALLALLKITGLDLRTDDPTALKDIIVALQERVREVETAQKKDIGEEFGLRVKFMLDMIYELKNNKKNHFASAKAPANLLLLVKKARTDSLSEQLHVTWKELQEGAPHAKKWWIRGTSQLRPMRASGAPQVSAAQDKIMRLAKKQGMNTDVRRAIFATIMNAEDYLDAFENLLKLELKGKQDREIVNVIIHCCVQEKTFNLFYGHLGVKLCSFDYNHKFTFQYNFWDRFRRMSDEKLSVVLNVAKLLAHMLGQQALSLSIFKVIEFMDLKPMDVLFLRMVFTRLFTDTKTDLIFQMFERLATDMNLFELRENLGSFFANAFRKSSLSNRQVYTEEEAQSIRKCVKEIKTIFQHAPTNLV